MDEPGYALFRRSVARVLAPAGEPVGGAFSLAPRLVATCAHVVTEALGGDPAGPRPPGGECRIDFALADGPAIGARVKHWVPIAADGGGDIAVLELDAPAAAVPPMRRVSDPWGHDYRVLGFPSGMPDGVWSAGRIRDLQGTGWMQLHGEAGAQPIVGGFSGTPVWDAAAGAVVGMTVATDTSRTVSTAYGIPIEQITGLVPELAGGLAEHTTSGAPEFAGGPAEHATGGVPERTIGGARSTRRRWVASAVAGAVVVAAVVTTIVVVRSKPPTSDAAEVPPTASVPLPAPPPSSTASSTPPPTTTTTKPPPNSTKSSPPPEPSGPVQLSTDEIPAWVIEKCPKLSMCFTTGPGFTGEFHALPMDHTTGSRCRPLGFTARSAFSSANEGQAIHPDNTCGAKGMTPLYFRDAYSSVEVNSFKHT